VTFRRTAAVGIGAAALTLLAACTSSAKPVAAQVTASTSDSPTPTPSETPATPSPSATTTSASPSPVTVPADRSLSGLPGTAGKPVIAIKIDDTPPAHPQTAVDGADIVYVEAVEGGATRLMAVFQSTLPDVVGPVRSGRESDLEVLAAYGKVALVYSGAQGGVEALIRASPQRAFEEGAAGFFRSSARHAPYNLYMAPQKLLAAHPNLPTAHDIGFVFGAPIAGGKPATYLSANMSSYVTYSFAYDASGQRWLASIGKRASTQTDGQPLWATNVLVQEVTVTSSRFHDILGLNTPRSHTVGSGKFWLARPDGTVFTGTWTRESALSPTRYVDASGVPVTFAPGRTWVVLAPKGNGVTVR
jgi:hypothetical protein